MNRATWPLLTAAAMLCGQLTATAPAWADPVHAAIVIPSGVADAPVAKLLAQKQTAADPAVQRIDATTVADGPGFGSMTILQFPSELSYEQWLARNRAALGAPVSVKRLDVLVKHESAAHDRSASVYKVNVYRSKVQASEYAGFAASYIAPLMEGQVDKGVMLDYGMYAERGPIGAAQVILIVEYRGAAAFKAAQEIKANVRKSLTANHAGYASYDKAKDRLRDNVSETLAKFVPVAR